MFTVTPFSHALQTPDYLLPTFAAFELVELSGGFLFRSLAQTRFLSVIDKSEKVYTLANGSHTFVRLHFKFYPSSLFVHDVTQ